MESCSPSSEHSIYIHYLEIFCIEDWPFLSLIFNYSTIHLYQYEFMNILYLGLWPNTTFLVFLLKLFQLWPLGAFSVGFFVSLIYAHLRMCVCILFSASLFFGNTRCSRLILCISHFPKMLWFLLLEKGIRNQILGAGCVIATGLSHTLDPLSWKSKKIYVCLATHVHTHP